MPTETPDHQPGTPTPAPTPSVPQGGADGPARATSQPANLAPQTIVVSAGREQVGSSNSVNPPITLTSTFRHQGTFTAADRVYGRFANPTWDPFEEVLGKLEDSPAPAVLFASGMAAISAAVQACTAERSRIVAPLAAYNTTVGLFAELSARGRYQVDQVDFTDTDAVVASLGATEQRPAAALVWLESPSNPLLQVLDLPRIIAAARQVGALTVVDNTFATPLGCQPLALGADLVVHSVTKFLAGHSDVLMGAVVPSTAELRETVLAHRTMHGAIPGPFEAWLALRGVRTLAVRFERAQANAAELAQRLHELPGDDVRVRYPGLPGDPYHQLARRDLNGFGAIVTIDLGSAERADRLVEGVRLWTAATSLGGVESLLERRRRNPTEPEVVPEGLIRLSVGIEDVDDLWQDLLGALDEAGRDR